MIKRSVEAGIVLQILDLANQLKRKGDIICQKLGITTQQWLILLHLANDPNLPYLERAHPKKPIMASELADSLSVSRANITNLLTTLMQKNLIAQIEDEEDRRIKRLVLTEQGRDIVELIEPDRNTYNGIFLEHFSDIEKDQFFSFLQDCANQLNALALPTT